jgi:hypothetical protein
VYVVTPSLNKSYKFVSEWPYNSSQSYILNSLVKDLDEDDDIKFEEREKEYALTVDVNYPNNDNLEYDIDFRIINKTITLKKKLSVDTLLETLVVSKICDELLNDRVKLKQVDKGYYYDYNNLK